MKYLPLLNLYLAHPYYADRRCPDFRIEPTPATQRLLDNFRCVLKPLSNGVQILTALAGDGAALIPLRKGMTFAFQLWLQNASFALFTDLADLGGVAAPVYTNDQLSTGDPVGLKLIARRAWSTERFVVGTPRKKDAFLLSGRPLIGLQPQDVAVAGLGQIAHPTSYDAATNLVVVDSGAARSGDPFEITYPIAPRRASGVFAEVEITYSDAAPAIAARPGVYQVDFKAKLARWKYYVVTDSATAQFRIEDQDKDAPLVFGAGVDLAQHPDPSDGVASALAEQYPDLQRRRFVSEAAVACQQTARRSIQLLVDDNPAIGALPNPALRNYTIDAQPGDLSGENALFHVVTFFTHLIPTSGG